MTAGRPGNGPSPQKRLPDFRRRNRTLGMTSGCPENGDSRDGKYIENKASETWAVSAANRWTGNLTFGKRYRPAFLILNLNPSPAFPLRLLGPGLRPVKMELPPETTRPEGHFESPPYIVAASQYTRNDKIRHPVHKIPVYSIQASGKSSILYTKSPSIVYQPARKAPSCIHLPASQYTRNHKIKHPVHKTPVYSIPTRPFRDLVVKWCSFPPKKLLRKKIYG